MTSLPLSSGVFGQDLGGMLVEICCKVEEVVCVEVGPDLVEYLNVGTICHLSKGAEGGCLSLIKSFNFASLSIFYQLCSHVSSLKFPR